MLWITCRTRGVPPGAGVGRAEPEELPDGERVVPQPAGGVRGRGGAELCHPQHEEEAQL